MKLNRTDAFWDRSTRNSINENWDIIEGSTSKLENDFKNVVDSITDEVVDQLVDNAKLDWKEPVGTYGELPNNPKVGETRQVRDTGKVYRFDGVNWVEIQDYDASGINEVDSRLSAQITNVDDKFTNEIRNLSDRVGQINGLSTSTIDIYVDKSSASSFEDGTIDHPFKTIQAAADSIPKVINKDRFIKVADGEYDEEVLVKGIIGAAVFISKKGDLVDPSLGGTGVKVRSITFYDCASYCRVENIESFNASAITASGFIRFSRCSYGTVHKCRAADPSITKSTFVWDGSNGGINSSYFNSQKDCVVSINGSAVRVDSTNKHGSSQSTTGLMAQAADIHCNGDVAWINSTVEGVFETQGGKVKRDTKIVDLSLQNGWTHYSEKYKARAVKTPDGLVCLQGIIQGGTVGQGVVALKLPSNFAPKNNHIFGPFVSNATIGKVLIDVEGSLTVEVASGSYVSLSGICFYAG